MLSVYMLALARVAPFIVISPFGGLSRLPSMARAALIALLALVAVLQTPMSAPDAASMSELLLSNALLGTLAAGAAFFVYAALGVLGTTLDSALGWGFVQTAVEPNGAPTLFGTLFSLLGTAMFLSFGALTFLIGAVLHSVVEWPLRAPFHPSVYAISGLATLSGAALDYGLRASLPIALITLITAALTGVLSRLAPQAQVLTIEFPLAMVAGIALIMLALPTLPDLVNSLTQVIEATVGGLAAQVW